MKVAEIKKKFKNKWVLAEVVKTDELNRLVDVKPIFASKDRDKMYDRLAKVRGKKHMATLYTGKLSGTYAL